MADYGFWRRWFTDALYRDEYLAGLAATIPIDELVELGDSVILVGLSGSEQPSELSAKIRPAIVLRHAIPVL
ncbi:hypothetical protein [Saccharopolyspora mangrovi]|uniref:Uncharacterized protein n=1 Tax=Saccharopolyspora mangrovi TaxID=3082379 RepID=A0ABU6AFA6_9PSEU|nr:hypothetical protein [Saccharopolyspora sp. S2-29]MEB3370142.1 hypothetical protein [Saccharopolyspora sp. S2-29]